MQFDRPEIYPQFDRENMIEEINQLPSQLQTAWQLSREYPLESASPIQKVLIAGMGGSAIGADLVAAYLAPDARVPILTHRDYGLPGWAKGPETLVIASSHSGNTEETISAYTQAGLNGCSRLVISTGGELAGRAQNDGIPYWNLPHQGQPRAAVGYSSGLLLGALNRLGLSVEQGNPIREAVSAMRTQAEQLTPDVPTVQNPAKRYAGQLMGRWFVVFGAEFLEPVARRWKGQVNELAKAMGNYESIPEANHNTLAGLLNPEELTQKTFCLFLNSADYHPQNAHRMELTRKTMMVEGISTDFYLAQGNNRLAQQWTTLHFGDYLAYYLAIAYGTDPTPVELITEFKKELQLP